MLQIAKVNENATAPQSIGQSTESRAKPGDFDLAIAAVCALQSQVSATPVSTLQGQGNSGGEAGFGSGGMIDVNTVIDEAMVQNPQVLVKPSTVSGGIIQQVGYPVYASPTPVAIVQGQANFSSESASGAGQLNLSPVYSDAVLGQNLQETVEPLTVYQSKPGGGALPEVQAGQADVKTGPAPVPQQAVQVTPEKTLVTEQPVAVESMAKQAVALQQQDSQVISAKVPVSAHGKTNPVPAAVLEQNLQETVEPLTSFQPKPGGALPEVQASQVDIKTGPASVPQQAVQVAPEKAPMPEQPVAVESMAKQAVVLQQQEGQVISAKVPVSAHGKTNPVSTVLLEQNPQEPVESLTSFQPKPGGVLPEVQAGQADVKTEPASVPQQVVQVAPEKAPMPEQPAAESKVKTTSTETSFQTQAVAANSEISGPALANQQVSQGTVVRAPVLEQIFTPDQRAAILNAQEIGLVDVIVGEEELGTGFSRFDSTTALPENKNITQEAKLTAVFSSDRALSPEEIQNKPVFEKSEAVKTVKDSGSDTMQSLTTQFSLKQLSETQNSSSFTKRVDLPEFKESLLREIRQIITTHRGESQTQVQLRLEPEHLGHLTVKLFLNKGELNAHFYAESSYVKNILEGSIQQLKDALGQQDLRLNEALVFTGNDGQDGTSRYFEGKNRHAMSNHVEFNQGAYGEIQVETADLTAAEAVSTRVNYLI